jgi:hypothetical protein
MVVYVLRFVRQGSRAFFWFFVCSPNTVVRQESCQRQLYHDLESNELQTPRHGSDNDTVGYIIRSWTLGFGRYGSIADRAFCDSSIQHLVEAVFVIEM